MFLCDDCHKGCTCFAFSKSYGSCEGCGKMRVCLDCHGSSKPPVKK